MGCRILGGWPLNGIVTARSGQLVNVLSGRDALAPDAPAKYIVNIDAGRSLVVRSKKYVPVVFDDPARFSQEKFYDERNLLDSVPNTTEVENPSRRFLLDTARSAKNASTLVEEAWAKYHSPVNYGITGLDLLKVVALIDAGILTRLYYTAYRNNAFDTHVFQGDLHKRLLTYASDAVSAFMKDLERIGRTDDVVVMVFSEFGRRVPENVNLGKNFGTENLMSVVGKNVKGGQYDSVPSLTKLDAGDNLIYATDFRRVCATMISGWLRFRDTGQLVDGDFEAFDLFRQRTA